MDVGPTLKSIFVCVIMLSSARQISGQGFCNESKTVSLETACQICGSVACPRGMEPMPFEGGPADGLIKCVFINGIWRRTNGCKTYCTGTTIFPKCCPGYHGPDCQECPGGAIEACSGHGQCVDGMFGNGTCLCNSGFTGTACEKCSSDSMYGRDCDKECQCEYGQCNGGAAGDGSCDCDPGYQGIYCNTSQSPLSGLNASTKADIAIIINYDDAVENAKESLDSDSSSGEPTGTETPQLTKNIDVIKEALTGFINEFYIKANRIQIGFTFDNIRISPGSLNNKKILREFIEEKQFEQIKPVDMSVLLQEVADQFTALNEEEYRKDSTKVVIILTNSITDWIIDKTVRTTQEMNKIGIEIYTVSLVDTPVVQYILKKITQKEKLKILGQLELLDIKEAFDEIQIDLCNKSSLPEIPTCNTVSCDLNGHCVEEEIGPQCICNHGYKGDGFFCEAINFCLDDPGPCSENASCLYIGPTTYNCSCNEGFRGDGIVCMAIDPCEQDNGECPVDTTDCIYEGPGQSSCECIEGYENYTGGIGCELINVCALDDSLCHGNANCTTTGPLKHDCVCQAGYVGDGKTCYGDIIERIKELHNMSNKTLKGKFKNALRLMEDTYREALTQHGPFTVFVSTDEGFDRTFTSRELSYLMSHPSYGRQILRQHMVALELPIEELRDVSSIYTLQGDQAEILATTGAGGVSYRLHGNENTATVLVADVAAANGVIHVVDRVLDKSPIVIGSSQKTLWNVLSKDGRYNRLEAMLQTAGMATLLNSTNSVYTIFAPPNGVWDNMPPGTVKYLQSDEGKGKLIRLLSYHIIQNTKIGVADLINMERVETKANMFVDVTVTELGQVQLNNEVNISQSDISTNNGLLHHIDGVLFNDYLRPLLPHRCDISKSTTVNGACNLCFGSRFRCPLATDILLSKVSCVDIHGIWGLSSYLNLRRRLPPVTCRAVCQRQEKIKKCCPGFYGSDCFPCVGGHQDPCFGRGTCADGLMGDGLCTCNASYQGAACENCVDKNKFGPDCAQDCHCLKGKCDSRVDSSGSCLPNTCNAGYQGDNCDEQVKKCARRLRCHAHAQCVQSRSLAKLLSDKRLSDNLNKMSPRKRKKWLRRFSARGQCRCIPGYRGDGTKCTEVDPCQEANRGGCAKQARCYKTAPGLNRCECLDGWVGDGVYCYPSTPCLSHTTCDVQGQCLPTTAGKYVCVCKKGFHGNGTYCVPNNVCLINHGGCHRLASCVPSGPGLANCTCPSRLGGDGYSCYGSIAYEIRNHPQLTKLYELLQTLPEGEDFLDDLNSSFTLFAPRDEALTSFMRTAEFDFWKDEGNVLILASYHSLPGIMPMDYLKNSTVDSLFTLVARDRFPINITMQEETMYVNEARVELGDQPALNGLIHIIEGVLEPYPVRSMQPYLGQLLAQRGTYNRFLKMLNETGLLDKVEDMEQYTIFVPTDTAIHAMNISNTLLSRYLTYFIVPDELPMWKLIGKSMNLSSLLGDQLQAVLSITSKQNKVFVNQFLITEGDMWSSGGVVHGISGWLHPVLNWCDSLSYKHQWGGCGSCLSAGGELCPMEYNPATPLAQKRNCTYLPEGSAFQQSEGCQILCVKSEVEKRCCHGYYGPECRECPGGSDFVCSRHGQCDEGVSGFGVCCCDYGYDGDSCDRCMLASCEEDSCGVNVGDCPQNTECRELSGIEWAGTPSDTRACVCQPSDPLLDSCSVVELLPFIPNTTIFSKVFLASHLGQSLRSSLLYNDDNSTLHSISLFVPLDSGIADAESFNDSASGTLLDHIYKDEIILGNYLVNGTSFKSMSDLWLSITKYFRNSTVNETFSVNGVPVVTANIICVNGVIHLLSAPLDLSTPTSNRVVGISQNTSSVMWAVLSTVLLLVVLVLLVIVIKRKKQSKLLNCGKEGSMQFSTLSSSHSGDLEHSEGATLVASDMLGNIRTSLFENHAMETDCMDDSQLLIDTN